ncbi:RidA family protein [uncultured Ilumatobacter sp.]|jgi:2-iminobutanoate/2-iminopropanoate deaminase|uniref:RidA family protein n=1 Tax=uncultured Ilumatobacter sp. TaxID=879968 RepID=UPI00374F2DD0
MSKPLGPYTPVVRAGDFIIISGQGGLLDGIKVDGGLVAETQQTMKNIEALLATMGASMSDVVKTTCFLTDMEDYSVFNEHYVAAFGNHRPSRSCVAVAELPANFVVEIEAWAYKPAGR